ncbi:MAG: 2TM domain-containing protein [Rikenellaceae bacterium]|nr:2TM domain-containing protein [Rikenellaceae bacterium]
MENSAKHQLIMSWTRFVVVCGFLAAINAIYTPHRLWCLWIVAGWGMGQILQSVDYWLKVKNI